LRDYGTGAWDGGDPDCAHDTVPARAGRGGSGSPGKQTADAFPSEFAASECGKCGATRVDQQLGLEPTPDAYVQNRVDVFREVRRVLRADGTCWVNLGDSYAASQTSDRHFCQPTGPHGTPATKHPPQMGAMRTAVGGLKPKDLVGIPWRVAFALQADGWYLRSDIVWSKPNPMPESVTDRPTKAHEYVFLLTRSPRYFFDADAVREPAQPRPQPDTDAKTISPNGDTPWLNNRYAAGASGYGHNPAGRNIRSVWEIATQPYPEAHFATFPEALPERCIKAGTSERGCCPVCGAPWERETVAAYDRDGSRAEHEKYNGKDAGFQTHPGLGRAVQTVTTTGWRPSCDHDREPVPCVVMDIFMGSGTVALVARKLGRRSIGIELNESYAALCARRLQQLSLFAEPTT
jgi:DNA modification methylase